MVPLATCWLSESSKLNSAGDHLTRGRDSQVLLTVVWLSVFFAVLAWSAWAPHDYATWWLEVAPALVALVLLAATRRTFPLTGLAYWLILAHAIVLMVGGHYTYAEVPAGDWLRDLVGGSRNNYDKLGHFAQGFVPAIVAREILIRNRVISRHGWLGFIVVCICLAISAFYELVEWWVALLSQEAAEAFLGTQGYTWDTQSDMFLALLGAVAAVLLMSRWHDRQIQGLVAR
jgi:putative membrane protein